MNLAPVILTDGGEGALERPCAARRDGLAELLGGWSPDRHPELIAVLQILARDLIDQDAERVRELVSRGPADQAAATGARSRA